MRASPISVPLIKDAIDNEKKIEGKSGSIPVMQMHEYTIFVLKELLREVLKKANLGEDDV